MCAREHMVRVRASRQSSKCSSKSESREAPSRLRRKVPSRLGSVLQHYQQKELKKAPMEREQACNADWCLSLLMSLLRVSHIAADSHYDILQSCSSWIYEYVSADSCFWCCWAMFLCFWKKERYCSLIMSISVPHKNGFVVFVQTCWWLMTHGPITDHVNINNRDFFLFRFIIFFI